MGYNTFEPFEGKTVDLLVHYIANRFEKMMRFAFRATKKRPVKKPGALPL